MACLTFTGPPPCGTGLGWLSHVPLNHEPRTSRTLVLNRYWGWYKGANHPAQLQWFCLDCGKKMKHRQRSLDFVLFEWVDKPLEQVLLL